MAEVEKIPFLTKIPIEPAVGQLAGKGSSVLKTHPESQVAQAFNKLVAEITKSKEA